MDAAGASGDGGALWDSSTVHSISIDYDADEYASMIEALVSAETISQESAALAQQLG